MIKIKFKKGFQAVAQIATAIESLDDNKEYTLEIKEHKERRSLDANAYFWVLLDKLAEKVKLPKIDLYRDWKA